METAKAVTDNAGLLSVLPEIVTAVVCLLLAGTLATVQVAFARVTHTAAEALQKEGRPGAQRLTSITADPTRFTSSVQLARLAFEVVAIVAVTVAFVAWLGWSWWVPPLAVVVMIGAVALLGGTLPRALGQRAPEAVALLAARALYPLTVVLAPLTNLSVRVGRALTPGSRSASDSTVNEDELRHLVDLAEQGQLIDTEEREMIHSVFQLDDTPARNVMVPRTDMDVIPADASVAEAVDLAMSTGYSRIPVTGESVDDVTGIINLKDMIEHLRDDVSAESTVRVSELMRDATFVPDSKPVDELLREMRQQRIHMAIVIDEYGGTAGLITMEDIVEEIVGEIIDEYDDAPETVRWLGAGRARVSARTPIGDLADLFDVDIDVDELDVGTVGGLLAYALGRVPVMGSTASYAGLLLRAETPTGRRNRTATIQVEKLKGEQDSAD
ncbi:HlyC/CorC family transporter [Spiractinospora alimapuensis]|uniref:hemolysin family protein n=1 Tax=Spiractinospora alimapuensis TaxID=2820884 RepID=UPI001F2003DC|nr:hemolysin family protein [Spiractinospora alimapuensis]QVQ53602.1 HlyC/CorC family transporter [Spiractinospora alimapuensis]